MRERRPCARGEARQDDELRRRIFALNIALRIRLGVADLLCLAERLFVRPALALHLREDVVRRSIDDAANRQDLVRRKIARDDADHRHPRRNRRLKAQRCTRRARQCLESRAKRCEEQLVRRHHRSPRLERALNNGKRRIEPAHQLNDKVNVRRCGKPRRISRKWRKAIEARRTCLGEIAHGDPGEGDPPGLVLSGKHLRHRPANGSSPKERHAHRHRFRVAERAQTPSRRRGSAGNDANADARMCVARAILNIGIVPPHPIRPCVIDRWTTGVEEDRAAIR